MLLHDNLHEQACLRNELQHLSLQQKWSSKILNVQRKSFVVRQLYQQQRLRLAGLGHMKLIPNAIEKTHRDVAKFRSRHNGVKDLPPYQHLKTGDIHRAQDALFSGTTTSVSPDNSKETTRRETELETNTMKERGPSENGEVPDFSSWSRFAITKRKGYCGKHKRDESWKLTQGSRLQKS